jgi:hypothetical protein
VQTPFLSRATWVSLAVVSGALALGCGTDASAPPTVTSITPAFSPLTGGARITIKGSGFVGDGAAPNRVVIGGIEAGLTEVIDDSTLQFETPPGAKDGNVDVVVYNRNGYVTSSGTFHYSKLPTLTAATPKRILYRDNSRVVVTGTGFSVDDAGIPTIKVAGQLATDVKVTSDTELSFSIGGGLPMSKPVVELTNHAGKATSDSLLQYVPTLGKGFLLFSKSQSNFGAFYDPVSKAFVSIPSSSTRAISDRHGFRALFVDGNGNYFAHSRQGQFGQINFSTQNLTKPKPSSARVVAFAQVDANLFALAKNSSTGQVNFGKFDIATTTFTAIGPVIPGGQSFGLARLGNKLYVAAGATIFEISPTGVLLTGVTLSPAIHIADMRALDGILYGATNDGAIVTINPTSGITSTVETFGVGVSAMETFE